MANRSLLHRHHLPKLESWLLQNGWTIVRPRGTYEVLRANKTGMKPLIIYTCGDELKDRLGYK